MNRQKITVVHVVNGCVTTSTFTAARSSVTWVSDTVASLECEDGRDMADNSPFISAIFGNCQYTTRHWVNETT